MEKCDLVQATWIPLVIVACSFLNPERRRIQYWRVVGLLDTLSGLRSVRGQLAGRREPAAGAQDLLASLYCLLIAPRRLAMALVDGASQAGRTLGWFGPEILGESFRMGAKELRSFQRMLTEQKWHCMLIPARPSRNEQRRCPLVQNRRVLLTPTRTCSRPCPFQATKLDRKGL